MPDPDRPDRSRRRTGLPDDDALIEAADQEQAKFDDAVAVSQAEGVVTTLRQTELHEQQQAAYRRVAAAKGRLTRAQKDGDGSVAKIEAARQRLDAAYAAFDRISEDNITEMQSLVGQRLQGLGGLLEQMGRSSAASTAVTEALRSQPRREPDAGAGGAEERAQ
jgi:hypothetical protein